MYTPDNAELREKELDTKTQHLKKKLTQVQSELKYANDHLQQKEREHKEKDRKNVELLKKYIQDKDRLNESLHKCETKVKVLERKLEHPPSAAYKEPKASRQGKRLECTNLSSLEKEDLQPKPSNQPKTMK